MSSDNVISIQVLDRSYKVKCSPDEVQELQDSARYVDDQMRKMRQGGSVNSTDRVAVVTALNICHELMLLKKQKKQSIDEMNKRLRDMQKKIQNFLAADEEVSA